MPFNSREFEEFSRSYEFEHITSSPHYAQSNGKVENTIKIAKNLMKKAKEAGTDFYLSLLDWRNTSSEGLGNSPAQRMFGHRTRTLLPTAHSLLKLKIVEGVSKKLYEGKEIQTKYYSRHTKELPTLKQGNIVRVAPKASDRRHRWFKAQVEQQVDIRSYDVRTEDGRVYRRNRRHLRNSREPFHPVLDTKETSLTTAVPNIVETQPDATPDKQVLVIPTTATTRKEPQTRPCETNIPLPTQPKQTNQTEEPGHSAIVFRTGGVIKPPKHLKDYLMAK